MKGITCQILFAVIIVSCGVHVNSLINVEEFFDGLNADRTRQDEGQSQGHNQGQSQGQDQGQGQSQGQTPPDKPHIIVILGDDVGHADIGYNNPAVKTPFINKLASEGVTLTQNYFQSVCNPSRAALLTGKYPYKIGLQNIVYLHAMPACLPTNLPLLPELLKEGGYQTHMVGKWHLGHCKWECTPTYRGFDSFQGHYSAGANNKYTHLSGITALGYDFRNNTDVYIQAFGEYSEMLFRDRTIELIDNYAPGDDPLFMYVAFSNIHTPLAVPQSYLNLYSDMEDSDRKTAMAMMSYVDDAVKDIVDSLKQKGMWDNTFLYFASDNGGTPGHFSSNSPLNGCKQTNYEGGTQVPAFVSSPLLNKSGYVQDGMIHVVDILPTLLSIAGIDSDPEYFDGVDQSNMLLNGGESARDEIIYNLDMEYSGKSWNGGFAIRQGDMKLMWGLPGNFAGRGYDCKTIIFDDYYLGLIGLSMDIYDPPPPPLNLLTYVPLTDQQRVVYDLFEAAFGVSKVTRENMNTTGLVTLYNLRDDPYEYDDLSSDPAHADLIYRMKTRMLDLVDEGYAAPRPEWYENRSEASDPKNFPFHAWSPGWCDDVDMTIDLV